MTAERTIAVSARTVIDGCLGSRGTANLDTVYDVGVALGLAEQTVRLAIRRMQHAGDLVQIGRGRAGRIERTGTAARAARGESDLVEFAFAGDAPGASWDGAWRVYAFSIPEEARAERDALRTALVWLGAAPVVSGMYVSPHALDTALDDATPPGLLERWLVRSTTSDLQLPGTTSPAEIAERLWPAATTIAAYEPLALLLNDVRGPAPSTVIAATARALELAEGLDRALTVDPLLPSELRPPAWAPARLRRLFLNEWNELERRFPELPVFA
ncbi:PaaX family transcriptional regulator [Leucobacter albus]|uniref:PaaX family transcriptional regulator n=1 Tax=Leucobacter albus TaxID=272210 RepID=A0ABW3TSV0_9MICO